MNDQEYKEIRLLVPEDVYARLGYMSGAEQSWMLAKILHELLALREEVTSLRSSG